MSVEHNPYQVTADLEPAPVSPLRRSALGSLRASWMILLPAALFNHLAFDPGALMGPWTPTGGLSLLRVANLLGFITGSVAIWFWLLPLLENVALLIRRVVASRTLRPAWLEALYRSLRPAGFLALPGTVIWALWVVGFYYLKIDFVLISVMAAIPAHLLAACLYLPLLFRWGQLWWQARPHA